MAKSNAVFFCSQCGAESRRWVGRCPACGEWNSMVEEPVAARPSASAAAITEGVPATRLQQVSQEDYPRTTTGIDEFDRTLGGGLVEGSLLLIGGDPGIGKSTLLLQAADHLASAGKQVLYISGEESTRQVAMRAARIGANAQDLFILAESNMERIQLQIDKLNPSYIVVDSIQTVYTGQVSSAPGSVTQVRECAAQFMKQAKEMDRTVFLVGHVTKSGTLAGPRVLEHMVDTVMYFEGDSDHAYRILRTVKNRFGSTNEVGIFEMTGKGMAGVANPSEMLLSGRGTDAPGSVVVASMEGSRPMLIEIQALVCPTAFGNPRRQSAGVDYNRVVLLLAVLEKRAGIRLFDQDAYINVAGGLRLLEPALDLAVILSVASSIRSKALPRSLATFGEVGLTGEVRPVSQAEVRLNEAMRAGFRTVIMPKGNLRNMSVPDGLTVIGVSNIGEALGHARTLELQEES